MTHLRNGLLCQIVLLTMFYAKTCLFIDSYLFISVFYYIYHCIQSRQLIATLELNTMDVGLNTIRALLLSVCINFFLVLFLIISISITDYPQYIELWRDQRQCSRFRETSLKQKMSLDILCSFVGKFSFQRRDGFQ